LFITTCVENNCNGPLILAMQIELLSSVLSHKSDAHWRREKIDEKESYFGRTI